MELKLGIVCIYRLTCIKNKRTYIGQTKNLGKRHGYASNYKSNPLLTEDIQKFGWWNFDKEIVEECEIEDLNDRELHYIKTEKPYYNIRYGEESVNQIAESTKKKMSEVKKNDDRVKRQRVRNIDTGKEFDSITDAANSINGTKIGISRACRGIYKSAGGCKWEFIKE